METQGCSGCERNQKEISHAFVTNFVIKSSRKATFNCYSWLITLHFVSSDIFLIFAHISKNTARVYLTAVNWNDSRTKSAELHSVPQLTINHFLSLHIFTSLFPLSRFCAYDNSFEITINEKFTFTMKIGELLTLLNFNFQTLSVWSDKVLWLFFIYGFKWNFFKIFKIQKSCK